MIKPIDHESWLTNLKMGAKSILSDDVQEMEFHGETAKFECNSMMETWRVETLERERYHLLTFMDAINKADCVWDIGANIGVYTCFALQRIGSGQVIAFEPEPKNYEQLQRNAKLNGDRDKWHALRVGLSNHRDQGELVIDGGGVGEGRHSLAKDGEKTQTIQVDTADGVVEDLFVRKPDVVKIDVEGHELQVIEGMERLLEEEVEHVFIETHQDNSAISKLHSLGFDPIDSSSRWGTNHYHLK